MSSDVNHVGTTVFRMYATYGVGYYAYGDFDDYNNPVLTTVRISDPCRDNTFKFGSALSAMYANI